MANKKQHKVHVAVLVHSLPTETIITDFDEIISGFVMGFKNRFVRVTWNDLVKRKCGIDTDVYWMLNDLKGNDLASKLITKTCHGSKLFVSTGRTRYCEELLELIKNYFINNKLQGEVFFYRASANANMGLEPIN